MTYRKTSRRIGIFLLLSIVALQIFARAGAARSAGLFDRGENAASGIGAAFFGVALFDEKTAALAPCVAGEKTWDGEGATNNWSEAANWTCDAVPLVSDIVKFDAASTKNATVDVAAQAREFRVDATYTGTISIADGVSFTIGRTVPNDIFTQTFAGGSLVCGNGSFLTIGRADMTMSGGAIDCRNGTVLLTVATLRINGGVFDAPTGQFRLDSASLLRTASGAFNHNGGTVRVESDSLFGSSNVVDTQTFTINNLTLQAPVTVGSNDTVTVLGSVAGQTGGRLNGTSNSTWDLRGNISFDTGFAGGGGGVITLAGAADQTFFNAGVTNPNATWRIDKPTGKVLLTSDFQNFGNLDLVQGVIDAGAFTVYPGAVANSRITGGNSASYVIGKFRCDLVAFGVPVPCHVGTATGYSPATIDFSTTGGVTVEARDGVHPLMNANQAIARTWTFTPNGTPTYSPTLTYRQADVVGSEALFFGAAISGSTIAFGAAVNQTTNQFSFSSLTGAQVFTAGATTGVCQAGQKTWDGGGATNNWSEAANWSCDQVPLATDRVLFDTTSSKNATIDVDATVRSLEIDGYTGIVTNASANFTIQESSGLGLFKQTSGTFNGGAGTLNFNLGASAANSGLRLTGGTFVSTSGTLNLDSFAGSIIDAGAVFLHNGGTVVLLGAMNGGTNIGGSATSLVFNNLDLRGNYNFQGTLPAFARTVGADGDLTVGATGFGAVNFSTAGHTTVAATSAGGTNRLVFAGGANQTFANLGGVFPFQQTTLDKTAGTVTANAPLALRPANDDLVITSGTLYLASGANVTARNINIGANGRLVNDSAVTLTVGTGVVNDGVVDLQGGGAACDETPGVDPIAIISSNASQKPWTGSGVNRLVDVSVTRMGGTGAKTVFSGTNVVGNNASWVFNAGCPPAVAISPPAATVTTGQTQTFSVSGGFAPYAFSIPANNSGATINAAGLYTAGAAVGVTDTVRVTDFFGQTADSSVSVVGIPARLAFDLQPADTTAGAAIPAFSVAVQDAGGSLVPNVPTPVTLALVASNGAVLAGTTTGTTSNGVASFANLSVALAGTYTITASANGLATATSAPFTIAPATASRLEFSVQPSNVVNGGPITPAVRVRVLDAFGNLVPTAANAVTVAFANNPTGATLGGTATVAAAGGEAAFADLSVNVDGAGYTLRATAAGLTEAVSSAFDVGPLVVTNTGDSGPGSLRQAILDANRLPGTQTIVFEIPGTAPFVINPQTELPRIEQTAVLDATTQPGYAGTPAIEIRGGLVTAAFKKGLVVAAPDTVVKGFALTRWRLALSIAADRAVIQGNFVGLSAQGDPFFADSNTGIQVAGNSNLIGGPNDADGNFIAGNQTGIKILSSLNSVIQHNRIGTNAGGTAIGNTNSGVLVNSGAGNRISQNKIVSNPAAVTSSKGIQLNSSSVPLPNDAGDGDLLSNLRQNYPVVTAALAENSTTRVSGTLNSLPSSGYRIEFFSNAACDRNGSGGGETYLGDAVVNIGPSGTAAFDAVLPATALGQSITATATDAAGNTSEFSRCTTVTPASHEIAGRITDNSGRAMASVVVQASFANAALNRTTATATDGTYRFQAPTGSTVTVTPSKTNYTFAPASRTVANVSGPAAGQDFVGTQTATISGKVVYNGSPTAAPIPIAGVRITLTGAASRTANTDVNGRFSFPNLPAGSYTATAAHGGLSFAPPSAAVVLAGTNRIADFSAAEQLPAGRLYFDNVKSAGVFGTALTSSAYAGGARNIDVSPDGRRLIFDRTGGSEIASMNFDFTDPRPLAQGSGVARAVSPVWSPNGDRFAYVSELRSIKIADADGSNPQTVVTLPPLTFIDTIDWSPDGSRFLISTMLGEIWTARADGQGSPTVLLNDNLMNTRAVYSPDGTKIAYLAGANQAWGDRVMLMNADGTNPTVFIDNLDDVFWSRPTWSPDGVQLLVERQTVRDQSERFYTIKGIFSGIERNVPVPVTGFAHTFSNVAWGPEIQDATNAGIDVGFTAGAVSVNFGAVAQAGTTTVTPISPASAGSAPDGFLLGNQAYEISTTASVTPPITVCFTVAGDPTIGAFNKMTIFHNEGGVLVDRTFSRDFATKRICARTSSLSPFVLGEEIDPNRPSITGITVDQNGQPLAGVAVALTGTESRSATTDSDGRFGFVNLTPNGDYSVSPTQIGVLFSEYGRDFVNVTGEETVVFTGTTANFAVSGTISDPNGNPLAGTRVILSGPTAGETVSDANGNYLFSDLPADGSFEVRPLAGTGGFTPDVLAVAPLTGDAAGIDFTGSLAPTAAAGSVSGRVATTSAAGIRGATVTITDAATGQSRSVRTGSFGIYSFDGIETGRTYILTVRAGRYRFATPTRVVNLIDDAVGEDFIGTEPE
ncbi:MAG: carboxypeptidase regulatory-like domain-containing protein [Acidobacteria bacterium]|nr:carboxypeptidase regulatory-like domain-containing protein [Acidobacteriota bacterium]